MTEQEVFENIVKRIKALDKYHDGIVNVYEVIKTVNEAAGEYNNDWIPVSERMPKEHESMFAKYKGTEKWNPAMFEKISDDVNVTIEYKDGKRAVKTMHTKDGCWKPDSIFDFKVITWQPLPKSYQLKGE